MQYYCPGTLNPTKVKDQTKECGEVLIFKSDYMRKFLYTNYVNVQNILVKSAFCWSYGGITDEC